MPGTAALGTSIVDRLVVPIDRARSQAHAAAGDRIWRLYLERWTWAGSEEGLGGAPTRASRVELTNDAAGTYGAGGAPAIEDRRRRRLEAQGVDEVGDIVVRELSRTYKEAEIAPVPSADNERYFYALEDARGVNGQNQAARYFVLGTPPPWQDVADEDSDNAWVLTLQRVQGPS